MLKMSYKLEEKKSCQIQSLELNGMALMLVNIFPS